MTDYTLIVVNYRCEKHTLACLEHVRSLPNGQPSDCVVFDNSPDQGLTDLPGFDQLDCQYLSSPVNLGFAAAVNRAAEQATSSFMVLLNPDAVPLPDCLPRLVDVLRQDSSAALAGPRLYSGNPESGSQHSATRIAPNLITSLIEYTCAHRLVGSQWLQRHYFADPGLGRQPCATLQGACLALRRQVFEQLSGFDERFFFYWEDTDLSTRVSNAGHRLVYCPDLACRHEGAQSSIATEQRSAHFWDGFYRYHRKHGHRLRSPLLRSLLPLGISAELAGLALLNRIRRGQDPKLIDDIAVLKGRLRQQFPRPLFQ